MQHMEQSEYYSDTDVDEAFEDRVGTMGDGKQEGRGRLGIALSFSLVVMMVLFLFGTRASTTSACPPTPSTHQSLLGGAGCNVGWSTAGVALVAMAIEGIATQTSPSWVFKQVHTIATLRHTTPDARLTATAWCVYCVVRRWTGTS
jgi:hypothetical protein